MKGKVVVVVVGLTSHLWSVGVGAHDPYSGWYDREHKSCCNNRDCASAEPCLVEGREGWLERGKCWPLPPDREMTPPAEVWKHGHLHVCREWGPIPGQPPRVRCWVMARGA